VRGEEVDVPYDPESPGDAEIDSLFGVWGLTFALGVCGGVSLITALINSIALRVSRIRKTDQPHTADTCQV